MSHNLRIALLAFTVCLIASQSVLSQNRILLDENQNDWEIVSPAWTTENSSGGISLRSFKVTNDEQFLFIYFKSDNSYSLQNIDGITLYLDSDNSIASGFSKDGIGAEIVFNFGQRQGTAYLNDSQQNISFADLFMVTSPTVDSDWFEVAISRDAVVNSSEIFSSSNIKIIFSDESAGTGASTGVINYTFTEGNLDVLPEYSFSKKSPDHLRVLSHNVEFDGFFEEANMPAFHRLYDVIKPDIIGLSEIYDHSTLDVVNRLEEMLPSQPDKNWNAANIQDNFVVTRYTIKNSWAAGNFGNGVFLLDLRPDYNMDALVVVAHPPCCDNDPARQEEIDAIMSFIREAKEPGGVVTLNDSTPIIIMGDMNLVGDPQQVTTLLTGDIVNEVAYGNDFTTDWNGNDFIDAKPFVTGLPMTFTQGVGTYPGAFSKGRLDYIVYSGSVLELQNSYVLYTNSIPQNVLDNNGLLPGDTEVASDHFPVVSDFRVTGSSEISYTISSLRQNDSEGKPELLDSIVTVSGIVSVAKEFGNTGPAYLQSGSAGVAVFGGELVSNLQIGDNITITGKVGFYNGLTELLFDAESSSVSINSNGNSPDPIRVSIADILNQSWNGYEQYEGLLVEITGVTIESSGMFQSGQNYLISDGQNTMTLRVDGEVDLSGVEIPEDAFTVIGVISQFDTGSPYSEGYTIYPRFSDDIRIREVHNIADIRNNNESGIPVLLNEVVTVSGVVTVNDEFGNSGPRYIQDETAGMAIYGSEFSGQFSKGDSITITGPLVQYAGLTELGFDEATSNVLVHKSNIFENPKSVTIAEILNQNWDGVELYEGVLVNIEDATIAETGVFESNANYTLSDATGTITLRIDNETNLVGESIQSGNLTVTGIVSQFDNTTPYSEGYQLLPRTVDDIQEFQAPKSLKLISPSAGDEMVKGNPISISWTSENIETVNILYVLVESDTEILVAEDIDALLGEYSDWTAPAEIDSLNIIIKDAGDDSVYDLSGLIYFKTETSNEKDPLPDRFTLSNNYPNPFNPSTKITYSIPITSDVELAVYDLLGRRIKTLISGKQSAGTYTVNFDGKALASGVYMYRLTAGEISITRKMILNK